MLVFGDANSAFKPIDGDPIVGFFRRGDAIGVFALEATTRTIPGKYVLKDYNYRTPQVELVAETSVSDAGKGAWSSTGRTSRRRTRATTWPRCAPRSCGR